MKRKVNELSRNEYLTIVTRKRRRAIMKLKGELEKRGKVYDPRSGVTSTIMRTIHLVDSDLNDEELIRGVFTEKA